MNERRGADSERSEAVGASEQAEVRSGIADFVALGVAFTCWTKADRTYVWRSPDGRLAAWREGRNLLASVDGRRIAGTHLTLRFAMEAAVTVAGRQRRTT